MAAETPYVWIWLSSEDEDYEEATNHPSLDSIIASLLPPAPTTASTADLEARFRRLRFPEPTPDGHDVLPPVRPSREPARVSDDAELVRRLGALRLKDQERWMEGFLEEDRVMQRKKEAADWVKRVAARMEYEDAEELSGSSQRE